MKKAQMQEMIEKLSHDPIFDCYTRAALELRWHEFTDEALGIAYCDIDNMHSLNVKYGHNGVNERIQSVINHVRSDDVIAARWLNGDELIFILKSGDVKSFCVRIMDEFHTQDIGVTFSYSTWILDDAFSTIDPLDSKVQISKNNNKRGIILD